MEKRFWKFILELVAWLHRKSHTTMIRFSKPSAQFSTYELQVLVRQFTLAYFSLLNRDSKPHWLSKNLRIYDYLSTIKCSATDRSIINKSGMAMLYPICGSTYYTITCVPTKLKTIDWNFPHSINVLFLGVC